MGRRRRGIMSESFKYELAKDLGFYDVVQKEGWEGIRTKDAGNMVKRAIEIAQKHLANQYQPQQMQSQPQANPAFIYPSGTNSSYNRPETYR